MEDKEIENAFLGQRCERGKGVNEREKALLWPILQVLGVERKKWERFKYFPDQLVGLAIACIKERDRRIFNLRREVHDLQKKYAKVCQLNLDFKGCPFDPREKL